MPHQYSLNNVTAFNNLIEYSRISKVKNLFYASSSSVYGDLGNDGPVDESYATGENLKSYYAATKWLNEIAARSYRDLFNLNATALRFFTVYGEFGRPDMAYWKFTESLLNSQQISLYGNNGGSRNFTYIGDVTRILENLISKNYDINIDALNIAAGPSYSTRNMLNLLSDLLGCDNEFVNVTERPSFDVEKTWASLKLLEMLGVNVEPTSMEIGLRNFVNWFLDFRKS
jgi:UDP-glucuronate 4-epimerase